MRNTIILPLLASMLVVNPSNAAGLRSLARQLDEESEYTVVVGLLKNAFGNCITKNPVGKPTRVICSNPDGSNGFLFATGNDPAPQQLYACNRANVCDKMAFSGNTRADNVARAEQLIQSAVASGDRKLDEESEYTEVVGLLKNAFANCIIKNPVGKPTRVICSNPDGSNGFLFATGNDPAPQQLYACNRANVCDKMAFRADTRADNVARAEQLIQSAVDSGDRKLDEESEYTEVVGLLKNAFGNCIIKNPVGKPTRVMCSNPDGSNGYLFATGSDPAPQQLYACNRSNACEKMAFGGNTRADNVVRAEQLIQKALQ